MTGERISYSPMRGLHLHQRSCTMTTTAEELDSGTDTYSSVGPHPASLPASSIRSSKSRSARLRGLCFLLRSTMKTQFLLLVQVHLDVPGLAAHSLDTISDGSISSTPSGGLGGKRLSGVYLRRGGRRPLPAN